MRERKKTGVHGTLEMIPLAWKFNSKQLLCTTLNSRMNIIEARAVLNIVKLVGKCAPETKRNFQFQPNLYKLVFMIMRARGSLNLFSWHGKTKKDPDSARTYE